MELESAFHPFTSPSPFSSCSPLSEAYAAAGSGNQRGSRLLQNSGSSSNLRDIWSAAGILENSTSPQSSLVSSSPELGANKENAGPDQETCSDKSINSQASSVNGRESSSPLTGSSTSSSLEMSALSSGIFGSESMWGSFGADLGTFGSTEKERLFLESKSSFLKPPASASSTWSPFWSDLSPSLSPTNSETQLASPNPHSAPFSTSNSASWNPVANRRMQQHHSNSSPFSSGSASPTALANRHSHGKPLSANASMNQMNFHRQHHHNHGQGYPANSSMAYNRNYRRTHSHPANCHPHNYPANHHNHHHMMQGHYSTLDGFYNNGTDGYSCWNGDTHQDSRHYSPNGSAQSQQGNPLDSLKYSLEPHLLDIVRTNGWDSQPDSQKGRYFFGGYPSYDGFSDTLDAFDQMAPPPPSSSSFAVGSPHGSRRMSPRNHSSNSNFATLDRPQIFSRKVFVGGLPPDIDEEEITASFRRFGQLVVDWPHKAESKSYFPPKGYAFLLFQDEASVHALLEASFEEGDKLYYYVSSPTSKDKAVQIRPWRLTDNECYLDNTSKLDTRLTVFVGGVPRPLRAHELAMLMNQRFGFVAYAGIDVDSEHKYPKGAGRITFSNQQSYIAAINARFVQLMHGEIDKRVELKPYVLDDQSCDFCQGLKCSGRMAPLFCSQVGCLAYLCENCWGPYHAATGKDHHKPVTKESSVDRSRPAAMRW